MSFASFLKDGLKGGMSILFGHASDDAPKAEPIIAGKNNLTLNDITTLQRTLQEMTALTRTFGIAIYAYGEFQSPPALRANVESLLQDATDLSEKSTAAITKLEMDCEAIRMTAVIKDKIDETALCPITINIVTRYNFMLGSCENHLNTIATLQSIAPVARADEIQTRFAIAIKTGLNLYKDLIVILKKLQDETAAPAAEAGTVSRQP